MVMMKPKNNNKIGSGAATAMAAQDGVVSLFIIKIIIKFKALSYHNLDYKSIDKTGFFDKKHFLCEIMVDKKIEICILRINSLRLIYE